jgi:predicted dehydrogenase
MVTKPYPLRTALIGLSASAATSWAAAAHLPALLSETGQSKFAIKALLNSSVEAAKSAVEHYKLPADTKTYGSPEDLAADSDIDLVICNTRVDKHYEVIIPSIRAGKDVFVEWPIAGKKEHVEEIVRAAQQSGSRVAVGLQRRWNPIVSKVRELVKDGKLGKLLNAEVRQFGGTNDREILPASLKYFAQQEIGGNVITIAVGHGEFADIDTFRYRLIATALDTLLSVVGDVDPATVQAKTQIQRPEIRIRDPATNEIVDTVSSDVPDYLSFNARLKPSPHTVDDATLSFIFRRGQTFPGTPSVTWALNFQYGEIRVQSLASGFFDADRSDEKKVTAQIHHHENDNIEDIEWAWSAEQSALPLMSRPVSSTLYAFADGRDAGDGWVSIEDAAKRAVLIEKLLNA